MEKYSGISTGNLIAIGRIFCYQKEIHEISQEKVADSAGEIRRFDNARIQAVKQLEELGRQARKNAATAEAEMIEAGIMILADANYCGSVYHMIEDGKRNAEYAVSATGDDFCQMFAGMQDEYMRERASDVKDVSERLLCILQGISDEKKAPDEPVILAAEDLAPSTLIQIDKSKILGIVTKTGSVYSHVAILAKLMDIPALTGVDVQRDWDGKTAVLDGKRGVLLVEPDEDSLKRAQRERDRELKEKLLLGKLKGLETMTIDGRKVRLYANIGAVADAEAALSNDAEGIGLFRTEFLYLEAERYPTEEEQFLAYRTVAEKMAGKKVIIRTMDIGADKQADYFGLEEEKNPAMGYRAIRISLTRQEIFRTQLRAIMRAAFYGDVAVMFPMIISVEEVRKSKALIREIEKEFQASGVSYGKPETGVMIETPAAVMVSGELAEEVDFFSIGTNDLTQYTLAVDRQNPKLSAFFDSHHPAVLRMIEMTVKNGHDKGIWVGICGELAADSGLTETFIRMGVDELSVAPAAVLKIREKIRTLSIK